MGGTGGGLPNSHRKFSRSVSLVCWAYNEEECIGAFIERASVLLDCLVEDYEIILIDDGSTDRTYEIASTFQKDKPHLKIFKNERNLGAGVSSQRAIHRASKEYLFWQTIDWCYDISNLRAFLEHLKTYQIVQGVRTKPVQVETRFIRPLVVIVRLFGVRHITRRSDTIPKAIISIINYILIRAFFRVPLSDFQNVTFYPTKWVQSVNFEASSSFVSPEGLIKSYWNGMSIKEVPISFLPRQTGKAKGTRPKAIMKSVSDIVSLWFKWCVLGQRDPPKKGYIKRLNPNEGEMS
jgi:glycosyltransferase involved in cell wall biosynthesis